MFVVLLGFESCVHFLVVSCIGMCRVLFLGELFVCLFCLLLWLGGVFFMSCNGLMLHYCCLPLLCLLCFNMLCCVVTFVVLVVHYSIMCCVLCYLCLLICFVCVCILGIVTHVLCWCCLGFVVCCCCVCIAVVHSSFHCLLFFWCCLIYSHDCMCCLCVFAFLFCLSLRYWGCYVWSALF